MIPSHDDRTTESGALFETIRSIVTSPSEHPMDAHSGQNGKLSDLGLVPSIEAFIRGSEAHSNLRIAFECDHSHILLDALQRNAIYLVIRSVIAARMSSGIARTMTITLLRCGESLRLVIEDNGIGFPDDEEMALYLNREGTVSLEDPHLPFGGSCCVSSQLHFGTTVIINFPIIGIHLHETHFSAAC